MRFKRFLLVFCASLLVAGLLGICLTPLLVATGLRLWIAHTARQEGLRIEFAGIEAPLWRPVVVHKLQIASQADTPFRVMIEASRLELELDFAALVNRSRGRFLRSLTGEAIGVDVRPNLQPPSVPQRFAWRILEDFLADNFKLSGVQLHVEDGNTVVDLHNGMLSGAQIEAGTFSASDITIESPWFRKSFSQLRGATSWQEKRLTVGALTLTRGLDLDSVTIDLSHIGESRLGFEMALDAFGGKLRASVSSEDHGDKRTWDVAGAASEISLAQMSDALDLTDRASGSLHACKFTFRGEATNLREATATVWAEVTGLTWRDRTADTIMIGASLYNHQVQVEQFFVKQRNNQFNLSGESALPQTWSDWLNPDFHGNISASIKDLGDFARLFGGRASDFAGKIDLSGNVTARERKLAGQLSVSGSSLILFRAPVESLNVELNLKESRLEIANLELRRKNDSLRGQATLDLAGDRTYSFTFTSSFAEVADYNALIPETLPALPLGGSLDLDWSGTGSATAHSGSFHARGHGLHPLDSPVIPFDAEFEGEYSPDNIFFRQFNLSNQHVAFNAFVTIAKDYFQLQTLRLDLNGKTKLQGDVFLPLALSRLRPPGNWLAALSEDPNFDLDLTLDSMDLTELTSGVATLPKMSGQASGKLEVHGTPASLAGKSTIHLRDFAFGNEPRISGDVEVQAAPGTVNLKATATARGSDPVNLEASIPFRLEKREPGYGLETDGPFSASLNFPAIFLSKLPLFVSRRVFVDGILSGRLSVSDSLQHPQLRGAAHLLNGRLLGGTSLSASMTFGGRTAAIDFAQMAQKNVRLAARGEIDFRDLTGIRVKVFPSMPVIALTHLDPGDCITEIELFPSGVTNLHFLEGRFRERIDEIDFLGGLTSPDWTVSLSERVPVDPLETLLRAGSSRTYPVCHDPQQPGKTLTLGVDRLPFP
jgi:hypothetical protein